MLLMAYISALLALVFLLLAEHRYKRMFKEPVIRHTYLFLTMQNHEWHSWKVDDDGLSILNGLMLKLYDMN